MPSYTLLHTLKYPLTCPRTPSYIPSNNPNRLPSDMPSNMPAHTPTTLYHTLPTGWNPPYIIPRNTSSLPSSNTLIPNITPHLILYLLLNPLILLSPLPLTHLILYPKHPLTPSYPPHRLESTLRRDLETHLLFLPPIH